MSKKQIKASKKPTKLSALEKELLGYAKKYQPVLLYGKDTVGRENLIRKFHLENDGIDSPWEFVGCGVKIQSMDDVNNELQKAINDNDLKRVQNLYNKCESTAKTLMCLDWAGAGGSEVRRRLISKQDSPDFEPEIREYITDKCRPLYSEYLHLKHIDRSRTLIERKGTLFIDNLSCYETDKRSYEQIATQLKKRYKETNFSNWLICYADNIDNFPGYFREQFKEISLDGTEGRKKGKKKDIKLRGKKTHYIQEKERSKILKKLIIECKGKSNTFIARKAMSEIEKKHGTKSKSKPWYAETTLAKEVSKLKTNKKRTRNAR